MEHSNFGENKPSDGDPPTYEAGPNGFLARAAAAGFEDDINALVTNQVLDDESRAYFRLLIDQYGLCGGDLATRIEPLRRTGKIAPGFYRECLLLHWRIAEALKAG
jgi:hypothetical protein